MCFQKIYEIYNNYLQVTEEKKIFQANTKHCNSNFERYFKIYPDKKRLYNHLYIFYTKLKMLKK